MTRFAPRTSRPARSLAAAALAAFSVLFAACESTPDEGNVSDDQLNGRIVAAAEPAAAIDPGIAIDGSSAVPADAAADASGTPNTSTELGGISWKGKDVSGWPVTANLRASVSSGTVTLDYDKSRVWPAVDGVCANCWAIVNIGGKWYAGTFEYLRPGQKSKSAATLSGAAGDHFKVSPLSSWRPRSGEIFGLMVSGLCRGGLSNVKERSNIVLVRWP